MLDKIFKSKLYIYLSTLTLFILSCAVVIYNREEDAVVLFGYIASAIIMLSSRLADAMLPAMLICVFVTRCYDSAATFTAKIPYFIPVVIAVLLHFIIYRRKLRIGSSFWGICAVALSVALGGLGTISGADYFKPSAVYYVLGLGIGMVIFYLLVKANFTEESGRDVSRIMYTVGMLACFCTIWFYIKAYLETGDAANVEAFQSSNNLATFLMLAMPFPLFYASKRYFDIIATVFMYMCIILTNSRGGLLMGTVEFLFILIAFAIFDKKHIFNRITYIVIGVAFAAAIITKLPGILALYGADIDLIGAEPSFWGYISTLKDLFFSEDEIRLSLIERMIADFKSNPVFGVGLGYSGNSDLYAPKDGAMNWYHMWFAQVYGGLGILGMLCYGYQLVSRSVLFIKNISVENLTFFASYIGLFLMSQVNPGEFCPMPYAALAVTFFIIIEKNENDMTFSELGRKIKKALAQRK